MNIMTLLGVIVNRIKYPAWCQFDDNSKSEYEEDYSSYREELASLFVNIA